MDESLEQVINNVGNVELIKYFCNTGSDNPVFLSGIHTHHELIKPLIRNDLLRANNSVKSYIFYSDKVYDFISEKCGEEIKYLQDKLDDKNNYLETLKCYAESVDCDENNNDYSEKIVMKKECVQNFLAEYNKNIRVISRYDNRIKELNSLKIAFKFLMQNLSNENNKIIFNRRVGDDNRIVRNKILKYFKKIRDNNEKKYLNELAGMGFYKEFSKARSYYITEKGEQAADYLTGGRCDEEILFEKMMQDENLRRVLGLD